VPIIRSLEYRQQWQLRLKHHGRPGVRKEHRAGTLETIFHQDINGDGVIGAPAMAKFATSTPASTESPSSHSFPFRHDMGVKTAVTDATDMMDLERFDASTDSQMAVASYGSMDQSHALFEAAAHDQVPNPIGGHDQTACGHPFGQPRGPPFLLSLAERPIRAGTVSRG
jgi:hypothetical protein